MLLESGHGFLDFLGAKPQRAVLYYYYYSHWTDISFLVHISVYLPVSPCWTQRFKSDPGVNFTVFRAGIRIVSCVLGFLPIRSLDTDTEKVPNPTSCILPPLSSSSDTQTPAECVQSGSKVGADGKESRSECHCSQSREA